MATPHCRRDAPAFADYRDRSHAFEHVAVCDTLGFNLTGSGEPERLEGAVVSASLFPLLGASAQIGRTFVNAEEQPGREQVVVLSHALYIVVRTAGDPLAAAATVRRELARVDRDQPISDVRTMDERIGRSLAGRRFNMVLHASFASLALTLAGIGIYGIAAFSVTERTHEIGVRLALGAQRRDVMTMIVAQGMAMTLIGTAIGVVSALLLARVMSSLLFGVSAADRVTFTAIPVLLAAVAFVACYIPARRATRVDPLLALRTE